MAEIHFGEVDGHKEGDIFKDRKALAAAGIHRPLVAGIDGNGDYGSSSIVLNGGYPDDEDFGDTIIYTGHGGNRDGRQIADQSWDSFGNKGLLKSANEGLLVRVTRGSNHRSKFSPKSGYVYGGLYVITDSYSKIGTHGFKVCRYKLEKWDPIQHQQFIFLPAGNKTPGRASTTTLRIIRDTAVTKSIKKLYNYTCQVCGIRISINNVPYAEGAHIKPLGTPHNGQDVPENVLCLCPNHHVMLDKYCFVINDDFTIPQLKLTLNVHKNHNIDFDALLYHRGLFI